MAGVTGVTGVGVAANNNNAKASGNLTSDTTTSQMIESVDKVHTTFTNAVDAAYESCFAPHNTTTQPTTTTTTSTSSNTTTTTTVTAYVADTNPTTTSTTNTTTETTTEPIYSTTTEAYSDNYSYNNSYYDFMDEYGNKWRYKTSHSLYCGKVGTNSWYNICHAAEMVNGMVVYQTACIKLGLHCVDRNDHIGDVDYATVGVDDAAVSLDGDYVQDMCFYNNTDNTYKFTYDWDNYTGRFTVNVYELVY